MIGKAFKWCVVGAGLAAVSAAALLTVVGVPKPPTLTTDHVGRLNWTPLLRDRTWLEKPRSKSFVAWMPDGERLLVSGAHRVLDTRIHLLDRPGRDLAFLPQLPQNARSFQVDPGRDYVITQWDEGGNEQFQLFRWDLGKDPPTAITPHGERSHFGAFEPDGPRIAYTSNRRNGTDFDVYTVDPLDRDTDRLVVALEGSWSVVDWSPGAGRLLLAHQVSNMENGLHTLDLATGEVVPLSESDKAALHVAPQFSRDGRALYYGSNRDTEFAHLRRLDLETGEERVLSGSIPWDVRSIQQAGDGSFLLVAFNEDGRTSYYLADGRDTAFEPLDPLPTGLMSAVLHPNAPVAFLNHTDSRGVARGYLYDLETGRLELGVGSGPRENEVLEARLIRYPTFDSESGEPRLIPAFVYPGAGSGPRPVIISVHGGPEAQAGLSAAWGATQRQGITVITPNVRGSTGYGRTFEKLDNGVLREDAVRDIGALLDWVAAQPDLDSERVAIVGGSYGGYMVLASLVHFPDGFRCGIDRVGVSNFVTFLENTADWRRDMRRAEYGDERIPEMREFLESISPLSRADRITSRLMVVQGANDPRVPVTESRQLVEKVSANGQSVSYIEAADEGHGFKKPWNSLYTRVAENQMLGECLGQ